MQAQGKAILLPEIPAPHIAEWFLEIGPTSPTGMGDGPVSWQEIDAWCRRTGIDLDPWESRTIRRMSSAFVSQRHEAKKPNCAAPFTASILTEDDRVKVDKQFAALVGALGKTGRKA